MNATVLPVRRHARLGAGALYRAKNATPRRLTRADLSRARRDESMKPAADEFEEIARRLKELEAERLTAPLPDDLPSDVEPVSMKKAYTIDEYWAKVREEQSEPHPRQAVV